MLSVYQYDLMVKAVMATHSRKDIAAAMVNTAHFTAFTRLCLTVMDYTVAQPLSMWFPYRLHTTKIPSVCHHLTGIKPIYTGTGKPP
jgi:hypothetical protein